jgi:Tol biopolymer transport system component
MGTTVHSRATSPGGRILTLALLAALGCVEGGTGPTLLVYDRDRHARITADQQTIVYYRANEGPGAAAGIYRVAVTGGTPTLLVAAVLSGLDLHPQTDSIVFSALATGATEPGLWIIGLDGGGQRSLGGGGDEPGYRWPAFSADGTRLAWEVRLQDQTGLDTAPTLWVGEWRSGTITDPRAIGPGRRAAWRPDGAALAVERRRPGGTPPNLIVVLDTAGQVIDTLGAGEEPVWGPDGAEVAYLATQADRGCLGVCFVSAGGGSPTPLSSVFMSFPGSWSRDGTQYVFTRLMRTVEFQANPPIQVEQSRLWILTVATGTARQVTY